MSRRLGLRRALPPAPVLGRVRFPAPTRAPGLVLGPTLLPLLQGVPARAVVRLLPNEEGILLLLSYLSRQLPLLFYFALS